MTQDLLREHTTIFKKYKIPVGASTLAETQELPNIGQR